MVEEKTFELGHGDFVLDMSLDHYGRRLATCSADATFKVYKRNNSAEGWQQSFTSPAAKSEIIKIVWSHPEYSMLIACCTNRSIMVWEEEVETRWRLLYQNEEFRSDICGLEFGPKHVGLRLAVCIADGTVEIYSPTDALRKEWVKRHTFGNDGEPASGTDIVPMNPKESLVSSISWNAYPFDTRSMVVSHGSEGFIWRMDRDRRRWRKVCGGLLHKGAINHVAWAPNMGRSFHMIATASSDGTAQIWSVRALNALENSDSVLGLGPLEVRLMQKLDHFSEDESQQRLEVFRVEWNITATVLATSCDDGMIRLWAPNFKGEWQLQRVVDDSPASKN